VTTWIFSGGLKANSLRKKMPQQLVSLSTKVTHTKRAQRSRWKEYRGGVVICDERVERRKCDGEVENDGGMNSGVFKDSFNLLSGQH
jgi:hypothetical protein